MTPSSKHRADLWRSALVFAVALILLAGFARLHEISAPLVHDEYAYLLSADTFVSGRLTNPSHPLWEHFETFHVLQHPSYQAKYPPGQGMVLAFGQLVGHPIVGVWLSWSAALAAVFWMLAGFLPLRWALLGPILFLFNPYLFMVWGQTYWGGAVATLGGALFFGGLFRVRNATRTFDGVAMGLGLFLLGNSRPMEGIATAALAMGLFGFYVRRHFMADRFPELLRRILIPFGAGLALLVLWTMYYNLRVTGNPFTLPYFRYHPELSPHLDIRSFTGSPAMSFLGRGYRLLTHLVGIPLLLTTPFILRRHKAPFVRISVLIAYVVGLLVLASSRGWAHYVAPILPLVVFLIITGLKGLWRWRLFGQPIGRLCFVAALVVHFGLWGRSAYGRISFGPFQSFARDRLNMIAQLEEQGGKHLILVRYGEERTRDKEWIYNRADIDGASVVWARDMGPEKNRALLEYFSDRTLWRVDVPPQRTKLLPYEPPPTPAVEGD